MVVGLEGRVDGRGGFPSQKSIQTVRQSGRGRAVRPTSASLRVSVSSHLLVNAQLFSQSLSSLRELESADHSIGFNRNETLMSNHLLKIR